MEYYCACIGKFSATEKQQHNTQEEGIFASFSEDFPKRLKQLFEKDSGRIYQSFSSVQIDKSFYSIPIFLLWTPKEQDDLPYYTIGYIKYFLDQEKVCFRIFLVALSENFYKSRCQCNPFFLLRSSFFEEYWQKGVGNNKIPLPSLQPLPDISKDVKNFVKTNYGTSLENGEKITIPYHHSQKMWAYSAIECIYSVLPKETLKNVSFSTYSDSDYLISGVLTSEKNDDLEKFKKHPSPLVIPKTVEDTIKIPLPEETIAATGTEYMALPSRSVGMHSSQILELKEGAPKSMDLLDSIEISLPTKKVYARKPLAQWWHRLSGAGKVAIIGGLCFFFGLLTMLLWQKDTGTINVDDKALVAKVKQTFYSGKEFQSELKAVLATVQSQNAYIPNLYLLDQIANYEIKDRKNSEKFWRDIPGKDLLLNYPECRMRLVSLLEREQYEVLRRYEDIQNISMSEARDTLSQLKDWEIHWKNVNKNLDNDALIVEENNNLQKKLERLISAFGNIDEYQVKNVEDAQSFWEQALAKIAEFPESQSRLESILEKEQQQVLEKYSQLPSDIDLVEARRISSELQSWRQLWQRVSQQIGREISWDTFDKIAANYERFAAEFQESPTASDDKTLSTLQKEWRELPTVSVAMLSILRAEDSVQALKKLAEPSATFFYKWQKVKSEAFPKSQVFYSEKQQEREKWNTLLEQFEAEISKYRKNNQYPETIEQFITSDLDYAKLSDSQFEKLFSRYQALVDRQLEQFANLLQKRQDFTNISQVQQILEIWKFCQTGFPYFSEEKREFSEELVQQRVFFTVYKERKEKVDGYQSKVQSVAIQYRPAFQELYTFYQDWQNILEKSARHEAIAQTWPKVSAFSPDFQRKLDQFLSWLQQPGETRQNLGDWQSILTIELNTYFQLYGQIDGRGISPGRVQQVANLNFKDTWYLEYLKWLDKAIKEYLVDRYNKTMKNWGILWWQSPKQLDIKIQMWQEEITKWEKILHPPLQIANEVESLVSEVKQAKAMIAQLDTIRSQNDRQWWLREDSLFNESFTGMEDYLSNLNRYLSSKQKIDIAGIISNLNERSEELDVILKDLGRIGSLPVKQIADTAQTRKSRLQKFSSTYKETIELLEKHEDYKKALFLPGFTIAEMTDFQNLVDKHKDYFIFRKDLSSSLRNVTVAIDYPNSFLARTSTETSYVKDLSLKLYQENSLLQKIPVFQNRYQSLKKFEEKAQKAVEMLPKDTPLTLLTKEEFDILMAWGEPYSNIDGISFLKSSIDEIKRYILKEFTQYSKTYRKKDLQNKHKDNLGILQKKCIAFSNTAVPETLPAPIRNYFYNKKDELSRIYFEIRYAVIGRVHGNSPIVLETIDFYKEGGSIKTPPTRWKRVTLGTDFDRLDFITISWVPFRAENFYVSTHIFDEWPFMAKAEFPVPWAIKATLLIAPVSIK